MNNKLDCEIIRDLLPSYADGLTSEKTNAAVAEHLADCEGCSEALRRIKEPEPQAVSQDPEVDYLKKVRRRSKTRSVLIGAVLMLIGMSMLLYRIFYVGFLTDAESISYRTEVSGSNLSISGASLGSGTAVSRVVFEESAGIVYVKVYSAPVFFFNSGDFSAEYTAHTEIGQVRIGDYIIWDSGTEISPLSSRLLAAASPYIGNMSKNSRVAEILGIGAQFGEYQNLLETSEAPFGWTLVLKNSIPAAEESSARGIMTADSFLMLAVIDNLGYVTWQYETEGGAAEFTVTAENATSYAETDIKELSSSPAEFEKLVKRLGIRLSVVSDILYEETEFSISVRNLTEGEIHSIEIHYYFNGVLTGGKGAANADNSTLINGDEFGFDFLSTDFPADAELSGFSFDLSVTDSFGTTHQLAENLPLAVKLGETYSYTISGSAAEGFTLSAEIAV